MKTIFFLLAILILAGCKKDDFTKDLAGSYIGRLEQKIPPFHNTYDSTISQINVLSEESISIKMTVYAADTIHFVKEIKGNVNREGELVIPLHEDITNGGLIYDREGSGVINEDSIYIQCNENYAGVASTFTYSGSAQ